jgi:cytochrome P450
MQRTKPRMPPGPKGVPLLGVGPLFARAPLEFAQQIARRYGDLACTRFGSRTLIWLNHPRLIEEVFVGQHRACIKDPTTRQLIPLLGNGLLTSDGDAWRKQRRLAAPALQPKRIASYANTMTECTERFASSLRDDELRDIHADIMRVTLEIVGRTLLGFDTRRDAQLVSDALEDVITFFDKSLFSPLGLVLSRVRLPVKVRFERALRALDGVVAHIIERARTDKQADYMLAQLMAAQDAEDGTGERMTDRQLRDEAMTMLLAGHETTALTITYALYSLAKQPACEARVRAELDSLGGAPPVSSDLERMPYLDAVVRETLRLYPPAWIFGREIVSGFALGGYELAAGMELVVSPFALHRDPRFFREPDRFMPERWLDDGRAPPPRYAYIPFGAGPRSCIGNHFAKLEAALVLASLLQHVRLQVVPGYQLHLNPVITMRPKGGLPVIVRRVQSRRSVRPSAPAQLI